MGPGAVEGGRWLADPACPRCGYALGGAVSSWRESCPLEGVCPECGLELRWGEVLDARRRALAWSFEHGTRAQPGTFLGTLRRALVPGALWGRRGLTMADPVVARRLAVFGVLAPLAVHGAVALVVCGVCLWNPSLAWVPSSVFVSGSGGQTRWHALATGLWPYRAWVLNNSAWSPEWAWVNPWAAHLVLTALLAPWTFALLPWTLARARVRRAHLVRLGCLSLPVVPLVLGLGLGLVELPRIVAGAMEMGGQTVPGWLYELAGFMSGQVRTVALGELLVLLAWWWLAATRYLRLERAGLVAAAMLVLAALGGAVVLVSVPGVADLWVEGVWGR